MDYPVNSYGFPCQSIFSVLGTESGLGLWVWSFFFALFEWRTQQFTLELGVGHGFGVIMYQHGESSHLRHHLCNLGPKGDNLLHLIGVGVALFLIIVIAFVRSPVS